MEQLTHDKDRQMDEVRQQNTAALQRVLRDEQQQRERAVDEERRKKEELRQRLQQEQDNIQKDLDEARQQNERIREEKDNIQRLLNEEQRQKATVVEMLSDADSAIARYQQAQENEVLNIPSHDIQLTGTELGRGSYGGEMRFDHKVAS